MKKTLAVVCAVAALSFAAAPEAQARGCIKGAFLGAMLIGLADTFGKVFVPDFASFTVYGVMAAVLLWKPRGLFS